MICRRRLVSSVLLLLILVFSLGLFLGRKTAIINKPTTSQPSPPAKTETPTLHKVTRVIDGDTLVIDSGEHVRYLGMNAPEIGRPWSGEAKKENENLVAGKTVRLELDSVKKDKYGRLLAYLWIDQTLVNEKLLAEGLAKVLIFNNEPPLKYETRLRAAEAAAQKNGLGLWRKEWVN